jgi:rhodanese-related sulfurtransferase
MHRRVIMKKFSFVLAVFLVLGLGINLSSAKGVFVYEKPRVSHPGKELAPLDAYAIIKDDPTHMIIVDVRTQAEYQFVGHPKGAYLIPSQFMGKVFKEKEYEMIKNDEFGSTILKKFNPETDTLFFLCRSGTRAAMALSEAVSAGWPAEKAYVILGGFQGDKMQDKNSAFYGQRVGGGWKNEGLPWTYAMDPKLIY